MDIIVVDGDVLLQLTEAIVNPWNRNIVPWWALMFQGVSAAIRRHAGVGPFRELGRAGVLPPGGAVATGAGRLPYRVIIHVACVGVLGHSSAALVQQSVMNAMALAEGLSLRSVAFPVLGGGVGALPADQAEAAMVATFARLHSTVEVVLVRALR